MTPTIGYTVIFLLVFGGFIASGLKRAYAFAAARMGSAPSLAGIFTAKIELPIWKAVLLLAAFWMIAAGGSPKVEWPALPQIGWPLSAKATAATYVYEKDQGGVPAAVMSGLNKLNTERKILATEFEQNTTDGTGDTPEQYKTPLAAAKQAGLPSLVATAGQRVLKVTKSPKTEDDVLKGVP